MVLAIFLAMGAWRIGQARVLARRSAAIETLGAATVLCTDKTGTLTENRMAVAELWSPSGDVFRPGADRPIPAGFRPLLETAFLASPTTPSDPMDVALVEAGRGLGETAGLEERLLVQAHGLQPDLLATTNVWRNGAAGPFHVATKGAPEAISALCHLSPEVHRALVAAVEAMASRGMRVLGLATACHDGDAPAGSPRDYRFSLVGLVGLADPLRAGVLSAVKECRAAGIRVVMITGDHATTARAIAEQAGIADGDVLTGVELAALDDAALAERLDRVTVFARIMPQQKLRFVEALKAGARWSR
jgi:Ca2+-transporting ATPase